jgi:hypothetical protein
LIIVNYIKNQILQDIEANDEQVKMPRRAFGRKMRKILDFFATRSG